MKERIANKIIAKVRKRWESKIPEGTSLDEWQLKKIKQMLLLCPDEDGLKRVTLVETGKTHLVPYEDIIVYGLKWTEFSKYPIEETQK